VKPWEGSIVDQGAACLPVFSVSPPRAARAPSFDPNTGRRRRSGRKVFSKLTQ
jgi:hypothetical protein